MSKKKAPNVFPFDVCFFFQCPEVVIELYNTVIDHIINVVTDAKLKDISWPIPEFVITTTGGKKKCFLCKKTTAFPLLKESPNDTYFRST